VSSSSSACEPAGRLRLPEVTLCAATSVNLAATVDALTTSLDEIEFGACLLFTHASPPALDGRIRWVPTPPLRSAGDYSSFMLKELGAFVETSHCLVVQWDGFVLDRRRWRPEFLDFDYIGARWPQFADDHQVGNGGFSLRSRRLLDACRDPGFTASHPEDVAIGRRNRQLLEDELGLRFAPPDLADLFSSERSGDLSRSFGFHGVFNLVKAVAPDRFWSLYEELDDFATLRTDRCLLAREYLRRGGGWRRAWRMLRELSSAGVQAAARSRSLR
jgi:hypothetical protein